MKIRSIIILLSIIVLAGFLGYRLELTFSRTAPNINKTYTPVTQSPPSAVSSYDVLGHVVSKNEAGQQNQQKSPSQRQGDRATTDREEQPTEDWHLWELDSVLDKFSSSPDAGLDSDTANNNLDRFGTNALTESKSRSDWEMIAEQFQSFPDTLLGVAAGISLVTGGLVDAVAIATVALTKMDIRELRKQHPLIKTYPRDKDRNIMTTVHKTEGEQLLVAVKGSPEEVLAICTSQLKNNEVVDLTEEDKRAIEQENEKMAGKALRVLGVAYAYVDNLDENPESDLIWLGLTGMADPIRKGVAELMEQFHQAGIDTVMITGDQSPTAYAIAKELNLSPNSQLEILDSADLAQVGSDKLEALCKKVNVFARVSPADKLKIVQALQAKGKIVAMTGDGINDTPALKAANVGVAMGSGKADVVIEVADVVIEDDRLETMIDAVSRGRTIYSNIRKSVHFLLSTNLSEIMVTTVTTALGFGEPLNTMQLLWLNLVSDIFPGLALAMEPPEPEVLNRSPRDPQEPIIKRSDFERIALESGVISASALSAYTYGRLKYGQQPQASTLLFMSLTLGQVLHTISCRSQTHSIFDRHKLPDNPYVDGAVVGSAALQLLPIFIPPWGNLLQLAPLDPIDWLVVASSAGLPLVVNETTKNP